MQKSTICFWAVMAVLLCAAVFGGAYFTVVAFCAFAALFAACLASVAGYLVYSVLRDVAQGVRSILTRKAV